MNRPVSEKFTLAYTKLEQAAVKAGRDKLEWLNLHGLLATQARCAEVEKDALTNLYHRLENRSAAEILTVYTGKGYGTPEDMYRALLLWMEAVIEGIGNGELDGGGA